MTTHLTPKIDIAFKRIFGVEENKDLLISFVNSVVSERDQVTDVTILNPYNPQHFANAKLSILDIKAKGQNGQLFNIEIQIANEGNYDKRALYYWAKLYTDQLRSGEDYRQLSKAIGIHILNFQSIAGDDQYHHCFHIVDKKTKQPYFKDLELHTIELHKFESNIQQLQDLIDKIQSALDIWVAFLTRHDLIDKNELPPVLAHVPLKKALGVLEVMHLTQEERYAYEDREKWLRIEANALKKAEEKGMAIGEKKGIAIGEKKGIAIGKSEGIAIGEKKGLQKGMQQVARQLLLRGASKATVKAVTGLSDADLERL